MSASDCCSGVVGRAWASVWPAIGGHGDAGANRRLLFRDPDPDGDVVNLFTPVTVAAIEKFALYARWVWMLGRSRMRERSGRGRKLPRSRFRSAGRSR